MAESVGLCPQKIEELYNNGLSTYELAKKFNVNPKSIYYQLKKGNSLRNRSEARKNAFKNGKFNLNIFKKNGQKLGEWNKENVKYGEKNHSWKGGRYKSGGYIFIYSPEHPNNNQGYVCEHRLVIEKEIGRYLENWEHIHHINGVRDDNRIENLKIVTKSTHYGEICCPYCKKEFLIR